MMNKKILTILGVSIIGIILVGILLVYFETTGETNLSKNVFAGTKISLRITDAQMSFINSHFDHVMTGFLEAEIREKIQDPKLLLYRSIQGTWTNFDHFDWDHINAHENSCCYGQLLFSISLIKRG